MVLDGKIRSFPQIDCTNSELAGGISGNAEISDIGSRKEAKQLAVVLQTWALPLQLEREREDAEGTRASRTSRRGHSHRHTEGDERKATTGAGR